MASRIKRRGESAETQARISEIEVRLAKLEKAMHVELKGRSTRLEVDKGNAESIMKFLQESSPPHDDFASRLAEEQEIVDVARVPLFSDEALEEGEVLPSHISDELSNADDLGLPSGVSPFARAPPEPTPLPPVDEAAEFVDTDEEDAAVGRTVSGALPPSLDVSTDREDTATIPAEEGEVQEVTIGGHAFGVGCDPRFELRSMLVRELDALANELCVSPKPRRKNDLVESVATAIENHLAGAD